MNSAKGASQGKKKKEEEGRHRCERGTHNPNEALVCTKVSLGQRLTNLTSKPPHTHPKKKKKENFL